MGLTLAIVINGRTRQPWPLLETSRSGRYNPAIWMKAKRFDADCLPRSLLHRGVGVKTYQRQFCKGQRGLRAHGVVLHPAYLPLLPVNNTGCAACASTNLV